MARDERFDVVIIGGGPNGMTNRGLPGEVRTQCLRTGGADGVRRRLRDGGAASRSAHLSPRDADVRLGRAGLRTARAPQVRVPDGVGSPAPPGERQEASPAPTAGARSPRPTRWAGPSSRGMLGQPPFTRELMRCGVLLPAAPARGRGDGREHPLHAGLQEVPAGHLDPGTPRDDDVRPDGRAPRDRALQDGHGLRRLGVRGRGALGGRRRPCRAGRPAPHPARTWAIRAFPAAACTATSTPSFAPPSTTARRFARAARSTRS